MNNKEFRDIHNLRDKLVSESMDKTLNAENSIILEAVYVHTGNWYESAASMIFLVDRLHTEIYGETKHIFLDGIEILEIHPLQFEVEGTKLTTKFNYKIHPKVSK